MTPLRTLLERWWAWWRDVWVLLKAPAIPTRVGLPSPLPVKPTPTYMNGSEVEQYFGRFAWTDLEGGAILQEKDWLARWITQETFPLIGKASVHRLLVPVLHEIWATIEKECPSTIDLPDTQKIGGCWVPRHILWNPAKSLSRHSWGIAWDLNPTTNQYGRPSTQAKELIAIWEAAGFVWGGRWAPTDAMHFECGLMLARNVNL